MARPTRLFLAILAALLVTAAAPVAPALATYGKIKVVKDLVPSTDSGRFDLRVDSYVVKTRAGDGDYGSRTVEYGNHSVSEVASSGTSLSDYTSSIKCTKKGTTIKSGSGTSLSNIYVAVGDEVICTITNTRKDPPKGKVEIEKQTDPADADASFGFTSALAGNFNLSDNGVKTVTNVTPNQNGSPYTVTESTTAGWRLSSVSCGSDSDSSGSVGTRTASIKVSPGETVHCTFVNKRVDSSIQVVKTGPALVHHGDSITYSFAVTTPGTAPLHNVHVTDDHCAPVSDTPVSKTGGNSDAILEPGETWVFTCTMPVPDHQAGEEDPIHNIATATGHDEWDRTVTDSDDHDTDIIHPAIHIVKSADPTQAHVGDKITYRFDVTNPGDTGLTSVSFGDARCDSGTITGPVKAIGDADDWLMPGEMWHWECTHVITSADPDPLPNTATTTGVDVLGGDKGTVTDDDSASVDILPGEDTFVPPTTPPGTVQVLGQQAVSGRATLRGQTGCASRAFNATVSGREIRRVTFYVDGRKLKTVNARSGRTRFTARVSPAGRRYGVHRVTARVVFTRASGTRARTLVLAFQRCGRVAAPVFTG